MLKKALLATALAACLPLPSWAQNQPTPSLPSHGVPATSDLFPCQSPAGTLLNYCTVGSLFQQAGNAYWYSNDATAGIINRLNNRVFVGGATANDGKNLPTAQDWLTQAQVGFGFPDASYGYVEAAQAAVLTSATNTTAHYAIVGAARVVDGQNGGGTGVSGLCVGQSTTNTNACFGGYFESTLLNASAAAEGVEIDVRNSTGGAPVTPTPNTQSNLNGLQLACGGQYPTSATNCGAAINTWNNPGAWIAGWNVGTSALKSGAPLINAPTGHAIQWINSSGATTGSVTSSGVNVTITAGSSGVIVAGSPVQLPSFTYPSLPGCTSSTVGSMILAAGVASPTYNASLSSGAYSEPAVCTYSGSAYAWTYH
jgi:hypothetical protein